MAPIKRPRPETSAGGDGIDSDDDDQYAADNRTDDSDQDQFSDVEEPAAPTRNRDGGSASGASGMALSATGGLLPLPNMPLPNNMIQVVDPFGQQSNAPTVAVHTELQLHPDHALRPIWIDPVPTAELPPTHRVILEAFSPIAEQAQDFLTTVAEPKSRPSFIHEYALTPSSLYAAVSVGVDVDGILSTLGRLCKTPVPDSVEAFVRQHAEKVGKVKLVLKQKRYFVESQDIQCLKTLLQTPAIRDARYVPPPPGSAADDGRNMSGRATTNQKTLRDMKVSSQLQKQKEENVRIAREEARRQRIAKGLPSIADQEEEDRTGAGADSDDDDDTGAGGGGFFPSGTGTAAGGSRSRDGNRSAPSGTAPTATDDQEGAIRPATTTTEDELLGLILQRDSAQDDVVDDARTHAFEVNPTAIEKLKRTCKDIGYPLLEEYDFRNDSLAKTLTISLKPHAQIRPYQEKALNKMFGNGRARSGIIVLPCGAGKTLVGITAAATMAKPTLVLCTSAVSVAQWKSQFLHWAALGDPAQGKAPNVIEFTSEKKDWWPRPDEAGVLISTYTMLSDRPNASKLTTDQLKKIHAVEWGLLLLDEVHVAPANVFRQVVGRFTSHTKLGLTATLVREDDLISDLDFLIGPKLYEANWMDLSAQGHIARVQCAEVWCDMTPEFFAAYRSEEHRRRQVLTTMNPIKFMTCQFLIDFHERRNDKIMVFSDNVYALEFYAKLLKKPFIFGKTPHQERTEVLEGFTSGKYQTIFLSKVGDTSIDLPEATCLIQISSHFGSRRQEAQRLGRILRAKRRNDHGFNAYFYTLVSKDTDEMHYSNRRQQFLVDQGYAFKVINRLDALAEHPGLYFTTPKTQAELLITIRQAKVALLAGYDDNKMKRSRSNMRASASAEPERTIVDEAIDMLKSNGGAETASVRVDARRTALAAHSGAEQMAYTTMSR
ncbi:P-loop containing nucleoside triphosphate hydrolase protein [Blastocladiella britannica]|nr:P-loop containing nucleoside triphosphate hydrolase protein [Blastocladiella britannica]